MWGSGAIGCVHAAVPQTPTIEPFHFPQNSHSRHGAAPESLRDERADALQELLAERILVLDGATGTWDQAQDLTADDFGGEEYEGCNEHLVLTRPELVRRMHREYFAAGSEMVETNTFGGTPLVLAEYGLATRAYEINRRRPGCAPKRRMSSRHGRPRFVAARSARDPPITGPAA